MRVLNLGAGVQSTTLYLMYKEGLITPQIDFAIFADTGEEPAAIYKHLEWMKGLGGPPILIRSIGKLGDNLMRGQNLSGDRFVSIPAYTASEKGKQVGIIRRQCTREYKIQPIEKCIRRELLGLKPRQWVPKGTRVWQVYGISLDEAGRAKRIRERMAKTKWLEPVFPLIERGMTRVDCMAWLRTQNIPHEVQKSACVFCPFHSNAEWRRLKETDPEGWQRAVQIDRALREPGNVVNRGLDQKMYVHRSCVPLEEADLGDGDERQYLLGINWTAECAGMCGV